MSVDSDGRPAPDTTAWIDADIVAGPSDWDGAGKIIADMKAFDWAFALRMDSIFTKGEYVAQFGQFAEASSPDISQAVRAAAHNALNGVRSKGA